MSQHSKQFHFGLASAQKAKARFLCAVNEMNQPKKKNGQFRWARFLVNSLGISTQRLTIKDTILMNEIEKKKKFRVFRLNQPAVDRYFEFGVSEWSWKIFRNGFPTERHLCNCPNESTNGASSTVLVSSFVLCETPFAFPTLDVGTQCRQLSGANVEYELDDAAEWAVSRSVLSFSLFAQSKKNISKQNPTKKSISNRKKKHFWWFVRLRGQETTQSHGVFSPLLRFICILASTQRCN